MIIRGILISFFCVLGLIILGQTSQPTKPTPLPRVASITSPVLDMPCSTALVPLPAAFNPKSLQQCQAAVRAHLKAMIGNIRVVVACREEFVQRSNATAQRYGYPFQSGAAVRANNAELIKLIPGLERDAEVQLKQQNTLALCKAHLEKAYQLALMQPEFRGVWQGR